MTQYKQFLLNLSPATFERIEVAAREQNVTYTRFLRQSVERNLRQYEHVERPIFLRVAADGMR